MKGPVDWSLKRKLTMACMLTSILGLVMAALAFYAYELYSLRGRLAQNYVSLAEAVQPITATALTFDDDAYAGEILGRLGDDPDTLAACIYDENGEVFASFARAGSEPQTVLPPGEAKGCRFAGNTLSVFQPIELDNEKIGTLFLHVRLSDIQEQALRYAGLVGGILVVSLCAAFALSSWLVRFVSAPIIELVSTTRRVSEEKDFALRAQKASNDELGQLVDSFNEMLAEIQQRDMHLRREIGERRHAEGRFRGLVESTNDWIWETDAHARYTYSGPKVRDLLGYDPEEILGRSPFDLMSPEEADRVRREFEARTEGHRPFAGLENTNLHRDGHAVIMETSGTPIFDEKKQFCGYRGIDRDVTERKHGEIQLRQAQKLESIGQLAAGIAHEINTPTQYVGDNTRFLQESFAGLVELLERSRQLAAAVQEGRVEHESLAQFAAAVEKADIEYLAEEVPQAIAQSLEGIDRVAKIVRAMKEFSHPGGQEKTATDINRAIENTVTVSRNEWKYVSDMVTDLDPSLPMVPCLPAELNQTILNLIVNAAQAIADVVGDGPDEKGKITVSTRRDGDWVDIRVSDTGTGIPEGIRDRLFDPFFTTKEVGKGTGQGLGVARSAIVDKHGGTITFETKEGEGTTFIVRLPLLEGTEGGGRREQ